MATKRPDAERTSQGERFRAYRRRDCVEVLIGEGDINDPEADVMVYPKQFGAEGAISQCLAERRT